MKALTSRAILMTEVGQVTLDSVEIPAPESGELLIDVEYTCISPGTELRCLAGKEPNTEWPFIPGYAVVGRVLEQGADTTTPPGTRLICPGTRRANRNLKWGGHTSHSVVMESQTVQIPEGVESLDAAAVKLAAIAYRGVRMSRPQPHESIAVIGLGAVGQFAARLHALTGANVIAADLNGSRVQVAQEAGLHAFQPTADTMVGEFHSRFAGEFSGADIVVDATGVPQVLIQAFEIAKGKAWSDGSPGSRLIVQGSYPDLLTVPYFPPFLREMTIGFPRDHQQSDLIAMLDLMQRGLLKSIGVISAVYDPQDAAQAYEQVRTGKHITAAFKWIDR